MTSGPRCRLFGDARLTTREGRPVVLRPTVERLLTALLVDRGTPVTREVLADRVWPDGGPADRGAALHTAIARLRAVLGADAVGTGRDGYRLLVAVTDCDEDVIASHVRAGGDALDAGDRGAARAELGAARELLAGPPLGGTVSEWARQAIERLTRLAEAVDGLARRLDADAVLGRDDVIAELLPAVAPGRAGLVVGGPAGIGKTALAASLVAAAGVPAVAVRCRSATAHLPLAPFDRLVAPGAVTPSAVHRALRERAGDGPLLLWVDDAAHLDPVSVTVVDDLADDPEVTLLLTARSGEPLPRELSRRVHGGELVSRVLGPLDDDATVALAERLHGAPLGTAARERLLRLTAGNPLHVRVVVAAGPDATGAARSLADFVDAEIATLPAASRAALTAVALAEPLPVAVAERVAPPDALADLEGRGLVFVQRRGAGHTLSVSHPLYGEVLREYMSPLMIRAQMRALARAAAEVRTEVDPLRAAVWTSAGGAEPDPPLALAAATAAAAAGDHALTERFARSAWTRTRSPEAATLWAVALFAGRPGGSILDDLDTMIAASAPQDRPRLEFGRALTLFWKLADPDAAFAALDELDARYGDGVAAVRAARAALTAHLPDTETALALAAPLVTDRDPLVRDNALMAASTSLTVRGDADAALTLLSRPGVADAVDAMPTLRMLRIPPLVQAGRLPDAAGELDGVERAVRDGADHRAHSWLLLYRAELVQWTGDPAQAREHACRAAEMFGSSGHPVEQRLALVRAAYCAALAGEDGCLDLVERASTLPTVGRYRGGDLHRALAEHACASGDLAGARRELRAAARLAADTGQVFDEVCALADLVRVGADASERRRLAEVGGLAGGLGALLAADAAATVRGDGRELAACAEQFAATGMRRHAARSAREAAQAFRTSGDTRAAAHWAARAAHLSGTAPTDPAPATLTPREREIALLAASGLRSRVVAERLHLSVRTVDNHLQRVYDKLGVRSRDQLTERLPPTP